VDSAVRRRLRVETMLFLEVFGQAVMNILDNGFQWRSI
jgi:hypothetical protein